jgi:flagellar biosynthetic protein FliP
MKKLIFLIFLLTIPHNTYSTNITLNIDDNNHELESNFSNKIVQIIVLLTVLSLAPSIVIMVTSFTKIVVVLSVLRNAMGLQQTPPNPVLISLAIFLTFFIMQDSCIKIYNDAVVPLMENKINNEDSFNIIHDEVMNFMTKNVSSKELGLFKEISNIGLDDEPPMYVLIPAFMISELRKGFEIGFLLFLPFIIIDLVIASILMAMGMMMLPPVMISLPFKLLFFVLIDGWYMICGSLVKSYII